MVGPPSCILCRVAVFYFKGVKMVISRSSDWAVLVIAVLFLSLIVYAIIHGRLQEKKNKKEESEKRK